LRFFIVSPNLQKLVTAIRSAQSMPKGKQKQIGHRKSGKSGIKSDEIKNRCLLGLNQKSDLIRTYQILSASCCILLIRLDQIFIRGK